MEFVNSRYDMEVEVNDTFYFINSFNLHKYPITFYSKTEHIEYELKEQDKTANDNKW